MIAALATIVIGIVVYVVSNKNANEAANRETVSQASREQVSPPMAPPAAAPIIIQQPVPAQQAPVIIQQPAQPSAGTIIDDATINEVATKRLADDPGMVSVSVAIREGVLPAQTLVRTNKYLNNMIEQDHRRVKQRCYPCYGLRRSGMRK